MARTIRSRAGNTISIEFSQNPSLREDFNSYKTRHNLNNNFEVFALVWEEFISAPQLTDEERTRIEQASKIKGESIQEFKKWVILKAADRVIKAKDKPVVEEEIDITSRTSSRAADLRVDKAVKELMEYNDNATEHHNRKFISQRTVSEYAQEQRRKSPDKFSLNMKVIKRYLTAHQDILDAHHAKHRLDKNHNREAARHQREQYLAVMKLQSTTANNNEAE